MTIWINEQLDPSGMIHACIASCDEITAQDCYQSFEENLTPEQKSQGWIVQMRTVESWDDVPVNSLKLN
ncbi:glycogen debranching protein [Spirulina subsalsa FACHB-351]|uniref:Glycogen debranching protein n=1 Tax=Spirulina subsalsa FACHB-351 TaxID=234711 RepID=A0ABT3L8Y7_9CYAN|nr:glycogen debranching protein [Spirulina subsalsa]MCW6037954.1 glycogen debranching protein [Spirulina subsalsa FACHB-351]